MTDVPLDLAPDGIYRARNGRVGRCVHGLAGPAILFAWTEEDAEHGLLVDYPAGAGPQWEIVARLPADFPLPLPQLAEMTWSTVEPRR